MSALLFSYREAMTHFLKILTLAAFLFTQHLSLANKTEKYKGIAYNDKNEIVYIENHTVQFSKEGKALSSSTKYVNPKGKVIGTLESDFTNSLSAPAYKYMDLRHKKGHGIKYEKGKLVLIQYNKDGTQKSKVLNEKFTPDSLIVGCQGLHYYLIANFEKIKKIKNKPVKFLTPGNLSYFNFKLSHLGLNKKNQIELEAKISNLILRIFAPTLNMLYNSKTKRLVSYDGLSNITDDNDKNQSVKIVYQY